MELATVDLSIVIPVYQESAKIRRDIEAAAVFLTESRLRGEIIVVDDGSRDDTAQAARNTPLPPGVSLRVLHFQQNCGKGCAVRSGLAASSGNIVMFADSGLCVPFREVLTGISLIRGGECDIAHASRKLPGSRIVIPQVWYRRVFSALFHFILIRFLKIPAQLTDTQCGFKIYTGEVGRLLYRESFTNGFMFDAEIILRALKNGYRIKEFPIQWTCDRDSRLSVTRTPGRVWEELRQIKRRLKT